MLAMTTRSWWILLIVARFAIGTIQATSNTGDSKISGDTNEWISYFADEDVPGVVPLYSPVPITEKSLKQEIPTTLTEQPLVPLVKNDKLSTTSKIEDETNLGHEVSSIEPIHSTVGKPVNDDSHQTPTNRSDSMESRGRALLGNDVASVVHGQTDTRNSLHSNITDLSDVSMDYDDKDIEGGEYLAIRNASGTNIPMKPDLLLPLPTASATCHYGNKTYSPGMMIHRDCEERCVCGDDGKLANCEPLCMPPFVRAGRGIRDALCQEKLLAEEPCCATVICAQDSEPEPEESCYFGNKTVARGATINDGCAKVCVCEAQGFLKCRPRCATNSTSTSMAAMTASNASQRDKCVPVPDPRDACCTITLCDVTLGDHEIKPDLLLAEAYPNITKVEALNSTAIRLTFSNDSASELVDTIEISTDNLIWREEKLTKDGVIGNLKPSHAYYVRVGSETGHRSGTSLRVELPNELPQGSINITQNDAVLSELHGHDETGFCVHRGTSYKVGAEWYDECISFCTCSLVGNTPRTECATIECPTDFGLDVLDPHCLDWESVPPDFVPMAPRCCSQEVRCKNNGSCLYEGQHYNNWSELPANVTGCEKRCYCEMGNVSCQPACPPVPALPPATLPCPPSHASLVHLPEDECCSHWICGNVSGSSLLPMIGRNGTSTYPGPLTTDSINQLQSIDDKKITGISESGNQQQWTVMQGLTDRYATVPRRKYQESADLDSNNNPDVTTDNHGHVHYPMDPGHPTTMTATPAPPPPYHGPFNPNFKPTQSSIEDVFRLTGPRTDVKTNLLQGLKDGPKSKTETKKAIEPPKSNGESTTSGAVEFAPTIMEKQRVNLSRFDEIFNKQPSPTLLPFSHGKPVSLSHTPVSTTDHNQFSYQKNYSSLPRPQTYNVLPPQNGGSTVTPNFPFHGPDAFATLRHERPNMVLPSLDSQKINPHAREPNQPFNHGHRESKPSPPESPPAQVYLGNLRPNPPPNRLPPHGSEAETNGHDLPEELYRLIHLQHPGLIRLNEDPPDGHQGLYSVVHPGGNGAKEQYFNPEIFSKVNENYGETNGYQVHHAPQATGAGTRQQIEEFLLHIGQKNPDTGPFQRYPAVGHESGVQKPGLINGPPRVVVPHVTQNSGQVTGFNHLFTGTTTIHDTHSLPGLDHNLPLPPGFPIHSGQGGESSSDQVTVQVLEAIAENRVRLVFTVPRVLVGLHGRVEVRYTSENSNDPTTWKSQVFAPPEDLIATPQLEFELGNLVPSTKYRVMVTVKLRDLANNPTSKIYEVMTLDEPSTDLVTLPPQIPTDAELTVAEVNSTWANIVWKKFTEYELQFIDGVQLRYKETEGKVYAATPLIHRAVTSYVIENLKPAVTYEVGIYFIPFPGQPTELISESPINFTTYAEPDPYSFDIKVEIKGVKSTEVEVAWKGVPYPEDKYVNIYRAIYQSDSGKEDTSTFKIAKRDSPARTTIGDLKPGTGYRLWIEVYLTNGRIKKSNVQDFVTKPGIPVSAGILQQQGKAAAQVPLHEGDYYGPLVIVAIVASLAILSTLILLMMLMKRRTSSKADISPRKTTSAYDNPSYKTSEEPATILSEHEGKA